MIRVQEEFQNRVTEIEEYFDFISDLDTKSTLLMQSDGKTAAYSATVQANLLRTLRASAFLLLYNVMESTVTNVVEAIFDELQAKSLSFDDCSSKVRAIVLDNLKAMGTKNSLPILTSIATDIVSKTFQKDEIVSGNVDAREIRKLAKGYGFNHPKAPQIQQHANKRGYSMMAPASGSLIGDALLTVKTHRNKLAHGSTSFADVGRDFTQDDIVRIKCEVIAYLDAVLQNVADYLSGQGYRR
jgi:hypothetical protein